MVREEEQKSMILSELDFFLTKIGLTPRASFFVDLLTLPKRAIKRLTGLPPPEEIADKISERIEKDIGIEEERGAEVTSISVAKEPPELPKPPLK